MAETGLIVAVVVALAVGLGIYTSLHSTRIKHYRVSLALRKLLDEQSGEIQGSWWTGKLEGHFRGRRVRFQLHESISQGETDPGFRITLSCSSPLFFEVRRKDPVLDTLFLGRKLEVGDRELDEKFRFSCGKEKAVELRWQFIQWIQRPEVKRNVQLLLLGRDVHHRELKFDDKDRSIKSLEATYGLAREKYLDISNVRAVLESMGTLAESLETST